ncbi:PpiC-type peptidyl-prolyl cis-trans isomerase [Croceitalea dokdonensis DOKDO 023]|uniref:Periplasmic chaperone PpiD n=1 Tax=Croceitalea dokdonensis DOKDO 023 TaxID=1300341 RepID=A0A0P7B122_9FLAO|nr:peptidylprolyl isomerase [Croceitalea dokdonensis]KPM32661.1 PpiC-type peptidyl-prolyl cis-trans isomerase [Croceitalea dokdonensis DOKDO 023]
MAILENIRKRTTVLILIIGLALFAFVISGVFTSNDFSGGKVGSAVAEVNGEAISIDAFRRKVEQASRQYGPNFSSTQLVNKVFDQEVKSAILSQQFQDLGIDVESDQIIEFIKNTGYAQDPTFHDDNGVFNEEVFKRTIADWKETNPLAYDNWLNIENQIMQSAKEQMYYNLVKAGVGATLTEGQFDYKLANEKVDLQFVRIPYSSIPDSTVQVSKDEIKAYIKEHEDDFKQEEARDVRFVFFEEKPSLEDENAIKNAVTQLMEDSEEYNEDRDTTYTIAGFRNTKDMAAFLDRNSDTKFDTIYKAKAELPAVAADTLMALPVGAVYGPYRDGDSFKVSKIMDAKPNGSVKASHILIAYEGAERANPDIKRTKEEAAAEAKRLFAEAKKSGVEFTTLARENSDGPSAPRGGDLGYFQEGIMADEFNDFCFGNDVGDIGLVETQFGFHVIKIDDKRNLLQVATLSRAIEASEETINTLFTNATKFEMAAVDAEAENFDDIAKESELTVRPVNKLKAMDENLPGLSAQRSIVQWAFNEDTNVGDIKRFDLAEGYAIVQLTKMHKGGLMTSEDASPQVLPILRKKKKAERIIAENKGRNMDEVMANNGVTKSTATAVTRKSPTLAGAGREPMVVGTAFGLDEGQTSALIEGQSGVFMVTVTKKTPATELPNFSTFANTLTTNNRNAVNTSVYNALKEKAEIEDSRAIFY